MHRKGPGVSQGFLLFPFLFHKLVFIAVFYDFKADFLVYPVGDGVFLVHEKGAVVFALIKLFLADGGDCVLAVALAAMLRRGVYAADTCPVGQVAECRRHGDGPLPGRFKKIIEAVFHPSALFFADVLQAVVFPVDVQIEAMAPLRHKAHIVPGGFPAG